MVLLQRYKLLDRKVLTPAKAYCRKHLFLHLEIATLKNSKVLFLKRVKLHLDLVIIIKQRITWPVSTQEKAQLQG
jgi:hypothetical protein